MSGIIFQTNAIDIKNSGGGYPTKTVKHKDAMGGTFHQHMISTRRIKGSDYVVFNCPAPGCGKRNKKSVYEAKGQTEDGRLSFRCYNCRREIEVQRPMKNIEKPVPAPIAENKSGLRPGIILGANGVPIRG